MPILRIPLVGSFVNRYINPGSHATKEQRFENCYPEVYVNPVTGRKTAYLQKRPGHTASSALSGVASAAPAGCVWSSNSAASSPTVLGFVNTGGTSTSVWDSSGTKIGGDIANTANILSLTDASFSGTGHLFGYFTDSSSGAIEAWYFPEGGAWTQVTDADFPPNQGSPIALVGSPVQKDGFEFFLTASGQVWNLDLNSPSACTANSYFTAQDHPDGGVDMARYRHLIAVFGKYSVEFLYNAGNSTGSPLSRVNGSTIRIGTYQSTTAPTVLTVGDTVYWIGVATDSGKLGVYRLNGMQAEKVSTQSIDNILNGSAAVEGFAGCFVSHGMQHVILRRATLGSSVYIPVYCQETNTWWNWNFSYTHAIVKILGNNGAVNYNAANSDAKIYTQSRSGTYTDDGNTVVMAIRLAPMDAGTSRVKFWKSVDIVRDQQTNIGMALSYSDDDQQTYSSESSLTAGALPARVMRLGASRRRAWLITERANSPARYEALEIKYEEGSH